MFVVESRGLCAEGRRGVTAERGGRRAANQGPRQDPWDHHQTSVNGKLDQSGPGRRHGRHRWYSPRGESHVTGKSWPFVAEMSVSFSVQYLCHKAVAVFQRQQEWILKAVTSPSPLLCISTKNRTPEVSNEMHWQMARCGYAYLFSFNEHSSLLTNSCTLTYFL